MTLVEPTHGGYEMDGMGLLSAPMAQCTKKHSGWRCSNYKVNGVFQRIRAPGSVGGAEECCAKCAAGGPNAQGAAYGCSHTVSYALESNGVWSPSPFVGRSCPPQACRLAYSWCDDQPGTKYRREKFRWRREHSASGGAAGRGTHGVARWNRIRPVICWHPAGVRQRCV